MKIYVDLVLSLNFFIDFLILYGVNKTLKENRKIINLLKGALFGSLTVLILFLKLNKIEIIIYKIVISILINLITFGFKNIKKDIIYFYLISIIIGGSLYLIDINNKIEINGLIYTNNGRSLNKLVIIISIPLIILETLKELKSKKYINSNIYQVKIFIDKKTYSLKALLDTGNNLKDPIMKRPVLIINNTYNINNNKKIVYVPYKALNTTGIIKCFRPDKIEIKKKKKKNILIGQSNDSLNINNVDCILPSKLKEEL